MNSVEVYGGKVKEREVIEATVAWCLKKMMPRMRTLDIEVIILPEKNMKNAMGYCVHGETNREFELIIQKGLSLYNLISTVCHEMVHVKQYSRGELRSNKFGKMKWKAKIISDETSYMDLPWEKEAFKKEHKLAIQCFEEINVCL